MVCDVLVIGGGPAGLAAACRAREVGAERVVVLERNVELGGILPQCIHNGFGVRFFGSDLTGPEYAAHWVERASEMGVNALTETMVLELNGNEVVAVSETKGLVRLRAKAIVLAMGCRERPRGALAIPGTRPAGVYTAGTAQRMVNIAGYMPGRRFVILGSGDIGMIMARRLTLEGAQVAAMAEILPYVSGLRRNLVQCVRDFEIPLHLCTTVRRVLGRDRVEGVVLGQVDARWRPIAGTEREVACDTLLLSVGLIPENELSRMAGAALDPLTGGPMVDERSATSVPGLFGAGNVVHVYDLVDEVTESALRAGSSAARYAAGERVPDRGTVRVAAGENIHHVVPQRLNRAGLADGIVRLQCRVREPLEEAVRIEAVVGQAIVASRRLRYVRPSEMITLDLDSQEAPRIASHEALTVRIVQ